MYYRSGTWDYKRNETFQRNLNMSTDADNYVLPNNTDTQGVIKITEIARGTRKGIQS